MFKETSQRLQAQALMPGVCYFLHPDFLWQDWNKGQPQTHLQEKPNQTKPNQTKPNQSKPNQTKAKQVWVRT